jgi:hypothetical protein
MNILKSLGGAVAVAALTVTAAPATEIASSASAAKWAAGTWQLVARTLHQDSHYADPLEFNPSGMKVVHPDGRFSMMIKRPHRTIVHGVRLAGRGQGGNGLLADMAYGTWSVDEAAKTVTFRFEMSTFPTWGREEVRVYSAHNDRWSYVDPHAKDGDDNIYLDWKRLD